MIDVLFLIVDFVFDGLWIGNVQDLGLDLAFALHDPCFYFSSCAIFQA